MKVEPPEDSPIDQRQSAVVSTGDADLGQHVLLTIEFKGGRPTILDSRTVPQPLPVRKVAVPSPWQVVVKDASGQTLFTADVPPTNIVRGEFKSPAVGGPVDRAHRQLVDFVIPVRIPLLTGAASVELRARPDSLAGAAGARTSGAGVASASDRVTVFEVSTPVVLP